MPPSLIPDPTQLRLHCLTATDTVITVTACTKASEARCPLCTQPSTRVHSRYLRTLADLPWSGIAVTDTIMWPLRPHYGVSGTGEGRELRVPTPTPAG